MLFLNQRLVLSPAFKAQAFTAPDRFHFYDAAGTTLIGSGFFGSSWMSAASDGLSTHTALPFIISFQTGGTIASCTLYNNALGFAQITDLSVATSGDADILVSTLTPSSNFTVTGFSIRIPASFPANANLRNRWVDHITGHQTAHFSATATLTVYTGAAPGVEDTATGSTLVSFSIAAADWTDPNATLKHMIALVAPKSNTASGSGTAGYARLEWTSGVLYRIQGSVGVSGSGADFILSNTEITSGQSYSVLEILLGF